MKTRRGLISFPETLLIAALLPSCFSTPPQTEELGRTQGSILGGRPSGDDENAVVTVTVGGSGGGNCTGRVVAPRLVLTARHCLLKNKTTALSCNPDGSPRDLAAADQTLDAPDQVVVGVGAHRSTLRTIKARELIGAVGVSVCRADIAFIVLEEDALPVRTPFRRKAVRIGDELVVTGWGLTGDGQDLPAERSTLDALRVSDVGPGFIPAGTFASHGNSLCFGDSGSVALRGGSVAGVYSRIEGDFCSAADSRNVFTDVSVHADLVTRAFAAVGESPPFEEEEASGSDAGPCALDAGCPPPPTSDASSNESSSCAVARSQPRSRTPVLLLGLLVAAIAWRRAGGTPWYSRARARSCALVGYHPCLRRVRSHLGDRFRFVQRAAGNGAATPVRSTGDLALSLRARRRRTHVRRVRPTRTLHL